MKLGRNLILFSILGVILFTVSLLVIGYYFQIDFKNYETNSKSEIKTPEYYMSVGTNYSVQELLLDPSLIRTNNIKSKDSIRLQPDGEGREYQCASISVERLSQDELEEYIQRSEIPRKFLDITDDFLEQVPQLKELIAATHQIEFPYNDFVHVYFDGIDFVEYEFFLADKMIEKYGGTRDDYFMKLDSDYEERLTNPKKQGFSNEFTAPRIIYNENVYGIGGTTFWTSDEHNLSMSIHLMDEFDGDQKIITLTNDDMKKIPKIKEGIENIGIKQESVHAYKQVPESEWSYYNQWYTDKSNNQFGSDHKSSIRVSGFVYQNEYYSIGFGIC